MINIDVRDLQRMLDKLENGEITYRKFQMYVRMNDPQKPKTYKGTEIGEWD